MTYTGGKNGSGVYQIIINQMPPHRIYVEAFLGSGAILRNKRPAPIANIGIDRDDDVIKNFYPRDIPGLELRCVDALEWMTDDIRGVLRNPDTLLYLDPPYLMETRSSQQRYYRWEMTRIDHVRLLDIIRFLPCLVMLSGYYSDLYVNGLAGWRSLQYPSRTRGGKIATEWLWMNYPEPFELHDYHYLGKNFRERERIKRKKARWLDKLQCMSLLERYAILDAIRGLQHHDEVIQKEAYRQ